VIDAVGHRGTHHAAAPAQAKAVHPGPPAAKDPKRPGPRPRTPAPAPPASRPVAPIAAAPQPRPSELRSAGPRANGKEVRALPGPALAKEHKVDLAGHRRQRRGRDASARKTFLPRWNQAAEACGAGTGGQPGACGPCRPSRGSRRLFHLQVPHPPPPPPGGALVPQALENAVRASRILFRQLQCAADAAMARHCGAHGGFQALSPQCIRPIERHDAHRQDRSVRKSGRSQVRHQRDVMPFCVRA